MAEAELVAEEIQEVRRPRGPRRATRKRLLVAGASAGLFVLLGLGTAVWIGTKAADLGKHFAAINTLVPELKANFINDDPTAASVTLDKIEVHTGEAKQIASDPLWTVAGVIPGIGVNFQAASEVARAADDVVQLGIGPLAEVLQTLDWENLMPNGNGVDLEALGAAKPKVAAAAHAVTQSSKRLNAIPADKLLPQVAEPLTKAREQLSILGASLDTAAGVASVAPGMMGVDAPRRYLLLIQNNAEVRSSGGIPGALAVLTINKGKLTLGSQTSAGAFQALTPPLDLEPEQEAIYSSRIGRFMQDINLTPDFPTAGSLALAMWEKGKGQRLDGAISIDPVTLGYILEATGPVQLTWPADASHSNLGLPDKLTGQNVVRTLLSDVYSKVSDPAVQDLYFASVAREVFGALSKGKSDPKKLLNSLSRGVTEGRILMWSDNADEQSVISQHSVSGSMSGPSVSPAQFGVYFNDGTGAKMDYYVKRTVRVVQACPSDGYAQVKLRVTSTNTAPEDAATSLSAYVTGGGVFGVPPGTVQTNIVAYGPVQANVETVYINGKKSGFAAQRHSGRPVGTTTLRLGPGQSATVDFTFGKIVQHSEPKVAVTPTIQALKDVVLDSISEKCIQVP